MIIYINGKEADRVDKYGLSNVYELVEDFDIVSLVDHVEFITCEYDNDLYLFYDNEFYDKKIEYINSKLNPERYDDSIADTIIRRDKLRDAVIAAIPLLTYGVNIEENLNNDAKRVIERLREEEQRSWNRMGTFLELHKTGMTINERGVCCEHRK